MSEFKTLLGYLCKSIELNGKRQSEELLEIYLKECMKNGN